jgi:hypothetical protein
MHRRMSDSRQSPIPQDRVDANMNVEDRAAMNAEQRAEQERYLKDRSAEDPAVDATEQPGIPDGPTSPADGGD